MRVLVTGGAGYVGSVVTAMLAEVGHDVTVLDDCSTGRADAVPDGVRLMRASVRDAAAEVLAEGFDAVMHFAARSLVGESVRRPDLYWRNNLGESIALLDAMRMTGTERIVVSSTAAVYGEPERTPILETDPARPINPYGASKLAVDVALAEYARLHGIGGISLRYFNVAGAYGHYRRLSAAATRLIAKVLEVAASEKDAVDVFGADYPTVDGTCIRDYVHVADLGAAHLLALEAVEPKSHEIFNLGSGRGFSVREVIEVCRTVTGHAIPVNIGPRRPGDPAVLIASSVKITERLNWKVRRDLTEMVSDAWKFRLALAGRNCGIWHFRDFY